MRGGMLLWVEMPGGRSGMRVFEEALRQGIRVAPGAMFSNSGRYEHFLRISCGQRHTPEIDRALLTLARIVEAGRRDARPWEDLAMSPALHEFIANYGLWAVLGGTLLEGESVVVFAGFLAHQHPLRLPGVMLCAFAGSLIADQALFYLGRRWRDHRLVLRLRASRPSPRRWRRWTGIPTASSSACASCTGCARWDRSRWACRTRRRRASWCSTWWRRPSGPCASACWAICSTDHRVAAGAAAWRRNQARGRAGRGGGGVAGPSLAGETPPLMKRKAPCLDRPGRLRRAPTPATCRRPATHGGGGPCDTSRRSTAAAPGGAGWDGAGRSHARP